MSSSDSLISDVRFGNAGALEQGIGAVVIYFVLYYGVTILHELTHLLFVVITGGRILQCSDGTMIGAGVGNVGVHMFVCYTGGYTPLVVESAPIESALLGIAIMWYGTEVVPRWTRKFIVATGGYIWIIYTLYAAGYLHSPYWTAAGILHFRMGDGGQFLKAVGPIGILPGFVVGAIGLWVIWTKLRNSSVFCDCNDNEYNFRG